MPFEKKRGVEFENRVLDLIKTHTYEQTANKLGVTRGVIASIVHRTNPDNKEKEKLRMRKRRELIKQNAAQGTRIP